MPSGEMGLNYVSDTTTPLKTCLLKGFLLNQFGFSQLDPRAGSCTINKFTDFFSAVKNYLTFSLTD